MIAVAVLLVPHEGDSLKLCHYGPLGSRPPVISEWRCYADGCDRTWWQYRDPGSTPPCPECRSWEGVRHARQALGLAWAGKLAHEGVDRAQRRGAWDDTESRIRNRLKGIYWASYIVPPKMGTEVLLDAQGNVLDLDTLQAAQVSP